MNYLRIFNICFSVIFSALWINSNVRSNLNRYSSIKKDEVKKAEIRHAEKNFHSVLLFSAGSALIYGMGFAALIFGQTALSEILKLDWNLYVSTLLTFIMLVGAGVIVSFGIHFAYRYLHLDPLTKKEYKKIMAITAMGMNICFSIYDIPATLAAGFLIMFGYLWMERVFLPRRIIEICKSLKTELFSEELTLPGICMNYTREFVVTALLCEEAWTLNIGIRDRSPLAFLSACCIIWFTYRMYGSNKTGLITGNGADLIEPKTQS